MVGKGSLNHNSRQFHAENTDPARSYLNKEYCNEKIKDVYHELFDEAVARYNAKQKRSDRRIDDYYEKIRSGKQEKLFHEIILQIGNKDDMGAMTEDGALAAAVLDEYMQEFQKRNPTLRVFSAHLHMDEATPHLHIDFVPYITGSSRGVDTRVSLKQALAVLGFKGGTRRETEWNQWANAEKEQLAKVMARHDIEWEHLGTHEEHLSVLEYKKQERVKEVAALEEQRSSLEQENAKAVQTNEALKEQIADAGIELEAVGREIEDAEAKIEANKKKAEAAQKKLSALTANVKQAESYAAEYTHSPEEWLPEPATIESAKSYRKRIMPLVRKVVDIIQPLYASYLEMKRNYSQLKTRVTDLNGRIERMRDRLSGTEAENGQLKNELKDFDRAKAVLGEAVINNAVQTAKQQEQMQTAQKRKSQKHSRDAR
ncbi:MAG: plasmid recombination protein [Lachnospiraceae bacterium]|nr:plasmid recombination protein [Lachnospiraceae bacterium]